MLIHLYAQDAVLGLLGPDDPADHNGGLVNRGNVALTITAGANVVVIEGTPQQLRERVIEGFSLPIPAGVALFDEVGQ